MYTVRTCIIPNLLITSLVTHVGFAIGDGYLYYSTVYVYHIIKIRISGVHLNLDMSFNRQWNNGTASHSVPPSRRQIIINPAVGRVAIINPAVVLK